MTYHLENKLIKIKINSLGAELTSLKTTKNNLEYMWEADPTVWPRHAPVLFPIVGKLKDDTFTYNGNKYSLPQHGFARDKEFELLNKEAHSISLRVISDEETLKSFPFPFELITTYTLVENKVIVQHHIKNPEATAMYFSIGAHPGFSCPLVDEKFEESFLEFEKEETFYRYKIKDGLLTEEKKIVPSKGNKISLERDLFKEDALVFKNLESKFVSIKNKVNDHQVKVSLDGFPFLGIWTKLMDKATFVCIEPWLGIADSHTSDGDFTKKEGIIKLESYQQYNCSYSIAVQ